MNKGDLLQERKKNIQRHVRSKRQTEKQKKPVCIGLLRGNIRQKADNSSPGQQLHNEKQGKP